MLLIRLRTLAFLEILEWAPALAYVQLKYKPKLSPRSWACKYFRQIPRYSAGASFLVQGFLLCLPPQTQARKDYAREAHTFEKFLAVDPFFPFFFKKFWCQVLLEIFTVWFDPSFHSFRRIDFLGWGSWGTQFNWKDSFNKATDPFAPPSFDFLLGFSSASTRRKKHLLPNLHPVSDW